MDYVQDPDGPLVTLPGQPDVPAFLEGMAAFIVFTTSTALPLVDEARTLPGYYRAKHCERKKTSPYYPGNLRNGPKIPDTETGGTYEKEFAKVFKTLTDSTLLKFTFDDPKMAETLRIGYKPEPQGSTLNKKMQTAFQERNPSCSAAQFVIGGQVTITGTMPMDTSPATQGFALSMTTGYGELFDKFGGYMTGCNLYFMALSGDESWTEEEKKTWPSHEQEEYKAIEGHVVHAPILNLSWWKLLATKTELIWHLPGCEAEKMSQFCGPHQPDKHHVEDGSLLFPAVGVGDNVDTVPEDESVIPAVTGTLPVVTGPPPLQTHALSGVLAVAGTGGAYSYSDKEGKDLWRFCSPNSLPVIMVPVKCMITAPVGICSICQETKEMLNVGKCGHSACTLCLAKWSEASVSCNGKMRCHLCRAEASGLQGKRKFGSI